MVFNLFQAVKTVIAIVRGVSPGVCNRGHSNERIVGKGSNHKIRIAQLWVSEFIKLRS